LDNLIGLAYCKLPHLNGKPTRRRKRFGIAVIQAVSIKAFFDFAKKCTREHIQRFGR
jgi:hypothetical protein